MTPRRKVTIAAALGLAPLALAGLTAVPAAAHGTMTDPVSRIAACHAEGPESPDSAACKALVAAGGTQPLYDWNEVNLPDPAGAHQARIPDGKLCSAGRDKYKGLDVPRTDWPSSPMAAGSKTFQWRATAPHKGTLDLFITKDGYDPTKPLKWSDLEAQPFASVTNPPVVNGSFVFQGTVPQKSGRHLIYSVLQRSDSPEAFYTCSDVVFGGGTGGAPAAAAPSEKQIRQTAAKSSVDHGGHGGDSAAETKSNAAYAAEHSNHTGHKGSEGAKTQLNGAAPAAGQGAPEALAATGGENSTAYIAAGGALALAIGAGVVFASARRRSTAGGR
ncbi:lytic polysaccharide monooxygenase auxiliary activity family 9 protein [Streptomyces tsukubensis]|uniref:Chitin-binding protein n=1 Tax=Streptomyces tsukubensis (strain DSM 42081 / NBRC 108919 / NRRL 18488 / 9993) TaxID=1114943 RepID=A0A7G3UKJ0_STRT9|nr:lytic polysaccharide monooxygenase [Streptomyces tsukubensis]AZK93365.1 chitin-binding protein [Streptomyces tsukubensis]QKM70478.1 chitin-binding protein [Streptomyces tsukubensis NRRL18488]TAI40491.1 LPXTG cell wall anchor domain-containing protein [Streptomyces tsukubensis]